MVSRRNLLSIFLRKDDDIAEEVRTVARSDLLLIDQAKVAVSAQGGTATLAVGVVASGPVGAVSAGPPSGWRVKRGPGWSDV